MARNLEPGDLPRPMPPVPPDPAGRHPIQEAMSRAIDLVGASMLIVLLGPVLAVIAAAVRLTSAGPALFRQQRVGQGGVPFEIYKFRSMRQDADERVHEEYVTKRLAEREDEGAADDGVFKMDDDPRITKVGGFIRRFSLDELPQLFNVVQGEMSLVGPRPAMDYEVAQYRPDELTRLAVRPGMTGLWQVSGRNTVSMDQMLQLDLDYVSGRSVGMDLSILARTAGVVVRGDGAR